MKFRIVIEQGEDGKFIASCPTLPGCWSEGDTRDEARNNIADAMKGYLDSLKEHGDAIPPPISEEIIDIDIEKVA
jgi:predicted RNase H-like HicB family nuclease